MKAKELTSLSRTELEAKLEEIKEKIFRLRIKSQTAGIKNPLELRILRKDIARILTILRLLKNPNNLKSV